MFKIFKKLNFSDDRLARLQDAISVTFDSLRSVDFLDGVRINDVSISSAAAGTTFNHFLQRTPKGWLILRKTAVGDIYEVAKTDTTLNLKSSSTVTADVWVF